VALLTVLTLSFRRFSYVMLPLLTVLVAVIWSIGAMALLGSRMTLLCIMLPVVLFAVGSAYAIHLVSHYKDEMAGKTLSVAEHRKFVFSLTRGLAKPIFLAALTTFAGFVSFCFGPLTSMRDFGVFSSAGVVIAFLTAFTLVPSLLLIRGPRAEQAAARKKTVRRRNTGALERSLSAALTILAHKKAGVFAVTTIVVAVSIAGSARLVTDNSMVEFFNSASEVSRSDRFMSEHFGGSTQIIVSVEAESTEILLHPDTLAAADGLRAYLIERVPNVGKVTGFTDLIKRMNQMFNAGESPEGIRTAAPADYPDDFEESSFGFADFGFEDTKGEAQFQSLVSLQSSSPADDLAALTPPASPETPVTFAMLNAAMGKNPAMGAHELARELERMTNYGGYGYYEIPTDPAKYGKETPEDLERLAANYLALLSGDVSGSFANDPLEPTAFEMIALVNSQWQEDTDRVIDAINRYVAANFPKNVRTLVGGGATQESAIAKLTTSSQISSILITAIAVLLIVAVSNKSLIAGVFATLPLSITILCIFAVMGFLRITLNMATALIASLAVGIGIDYTIHFMETFKKEFQNGGDYLYRTFATSGKAILINAVSVGASFAVLGLSQLTIVGQFGALVCLSMGSSAVVSLTVIPALLETVRPKFIFGKDGR
jgi:predicted RND superfamily exporter protein